MLPGLVYHFALEEAANLRKNKQAGTGSRPNWSHLLRASICPLAVLPLLILQEGVVVSWWHSCTAMGSAKSGSFPQITEADLGASNSEEIRMNLGIDCNIGT
jgi:hypothetical protein